MPPRLPRPARLNMERIVYEQFDELFGILCQIEKLFRDGILPHDRPKAMSLSLSTMLAKRDCLKGNTDKGLRRLVLDAYKAALHLLRMPRDAAGETIVEGVEALRGAREMLEGAWEKPLDSLHFGGETGKSLDSEATHGIPPKRPLWDRSTRTLTMDGVRIEVAQREAPIRFSVLDLLEKAGWSMQGVKVPRGFMGSLKDAIEELNQTLAGTSLKILLLENRTKISWVWSTL